MKPIAAGLVVAAAAAALLAADLSDARRLSGGRSLGAQRPAAAPTQPAAPPSQAGSPAGATTSNAAPATAPGAGPASNPVMAPQAGSPAAKAGAPASPAAPASTRSSWLGPVAGLAAGLGLAALASHLGFSEELMGFLLIALAAMAVLFVVRLMMARRGAAMRAPMPYAGAGAGLGTTPGGYETQVPPPARYEPTPFGGPPLDLKRKPLFPPGFDADAFAREAKKQFLAVQVAHDRHDAKALAEVMTPELHREILREMDESGAARPTEIVDVDAEIVDVATEGAKHWVSVRFAGTAREGGALEPFDEVWNLVKPVDGSSGWLIAGIQQQVMPS